MSQAAAWVFIRASSWARSRESTRSVSAAVVAAAVAPQQVEQAVVLLGCQDRHALRHRLVGELPLELEIGERR
jgi:hypothetical protein